MNKNDQIKSTIREQGLLPLFYHHELEVCLNVVEALYRSGIRVLEFTNRGEFALKNFISLQSHCTKHYPDLWIGIGTIKDEETAKAFLDAEADFMVSPGWSEGIAQVSKDNDSLWLPGCMTPSEVMQAERWSFTFVKLFPGGNLTPGFVDAIREVFPAMHFMPTGGVAPELASLQAWFKSGVSAVGMGSKLISPTALMEKNYAQIELQTAAVLKLIKQVRQHG